MAEKKTTKASTKKTEKAVPAPAYEYKPTMYVEGKQAAKLQKQHQVGKTVTMTVKAKVVGHEVGQDYMDPSKQRHNTRLEVQSMKPTKPKKK